VTKRSDSVDKKHALPEIGKRLVQKFEAMPHGIDERLFWIVSTSLDLDIGVIW